MNWRWWESSRGNLAIGVFLNAHTFIPIPALCKLKKTINGIVVKAKGTVLMLVGHAVSRSLCAPAFHVIEVTVCRYRKVATLLTKEVRTVHTYSTVQCSRWLLQQANSLGSDPGIISQGAVNSLVSRLPQSRLSSFHLASRRTA